MAQVEAALPLADVDESWLLFPGLVSAFGEVSNDDADEYLNPAPQQDQTHLSKHSFGGAGVAHIDGEHHQAQQA